MAVSDDTSSTLRLFKLLVFRRNMVIYCIGRIFSLYSLCPYEEPVRLFDFMMQGFCWMSLSALGGSGTLPVGPGAYTE